MQTMAGRAINEVFRDHIFRMAITFHGGANVIAYQWGDTKHCAGYPRNCRNGWTSSDHVSMAAVGRAMSRYAGRSPTEGLYAHGACNDPKIIYPVHGGMEDWAYGASWHKSTATCSPKTHGGYPAERTRYNNITHRMPNFLVETATRKKPPASELGTDEDVMNVGGKGDGHVPRNIRLMLAGIDMLEPYVRVTAVTASSAASNDDLLGGGAAAARPSLAAGTTISVSWGVGGCWSIEATNVLLQAVDATGKVLSEARSPAQVGACYWQQLGTNGKGPADASFPAYTIPFTATAVVPSAPAATHLIIAVEAKTDGQWQDAGGAEGDSPKKPQTHLVRARADPTWYGRNGPYEIVGLPGVTATLQRLQYCSTPSSCPPPAPLAQAPPSTAAAAAAPAAAGAGGGWPKPAAAIGSSSSPPPPPPVVSPAAAAHPEEVGLEVHQMKKTLGGEGGNGNGGVGRRAAVTAGATLAVAATHRWWLGLVGLGAVGVAVRGMRRQSNRPGGFSPAPLFGSSSGYTVEGVSSRGGSSSSTQGGAGNNGKPGGAKVVTSELEV
jgi:hypothetical protein